MSAERKRPPVRISFKYNKDTGEVIEFIVDDSAREASEEYHDKVAEAVSSHLSRRPDIEDAGHILHEEEPPAVVTSTGGEKKSEEEESTQKD
jgi:hypothetical protein